MDDGTKRDNNTEDSSSVQPLETKAQKSCSIGGWQDRFHRPWRAEREAALDALANAGDEKLYSRSERINQCCAWPVAILTDDGDLAFSPGRCRDRMCGLCCSRRSHEAAERLTPIVQAMNAARFMTLTLASTDAPLGEEITRMIDAFRALRRLKQWRGLVKGGVATLEITRNATTGDWHPHLHIIFDGEYYPQPVLKEQWHRVTGDSFIVHLKPVHDREKKARYIAKYIGKPADFVDWPPAAIAEYATAMHGRRSIMTFGESHNVRVDKRDTGDRPKASRVLNSICLIVLQANAGDPDADQLVRALPHLGGQWAKWLGLPPIAEPITDPERRKTAACVLARADERAREWFENGKPAWKPPDPPPPKPQTTRSIFTQSML